MFSRYLLKQSRTHRSGIVFALIAYGSWGLLPLYWRMLQVIPALEILSHRVIWSLAFVLALLFLRRDWSWLTALSRDARLAGAVLLTSLLLALNWFVYIWAVNAGYVVETSLGYFITPLVNVVLGVVLLNERMRAVQWLSVGLAAIGVAYMTMNYGQLPWIALSLAFSFGTYGLLKKRIRLGALESFSSEMVLLSVPAIVYVLWLETSGVGGFATVNLRTTVLLVTSGLLTAVPLICFAAAARRIPLSMMGIFQYLAPSLQLLIGVGVFGEPFDETRAVGFATIWAALLLYSLESLYVRRRRMRAQPTG